MLVFALLAAGILTAGCLYYQNYKRQFRAEAELELSAIADLKVDELVQYRKERLGDADTFYNNSAFSELVRRFLQQPADADTQRRLQSWLGRFQACYGYARINLFDVQGAERLAVPDQPEPLPGHMARDIAAVLRSGQMTFLDFHRDAPGLPVQLEILVPIFDASDTNRPLGVLVLRIDPEISLYPFIKLWPVPSKTAETLLVRRDGNDVLFLNELKFATNTALNRRISLENTNVPAVKAVLGQTGIVEGRDYRGVPVIADVRAVPDSPWFMVAHQDVAKVFAPLRERLWQLIFTLGVLLFGSGAGVGLIWRQLHVRFYRAKYEMEAFRAKLGAIVESSEYAIISKNLDGIITSWNPSAERIYGYSAAEAVGKSIEILIPPGHPNESPQLIGKIKRGEAVEHHETERIRKNGERIQVQLSLSPVKDEAGAIVGVSVIGYDITEHKRAEEALRESEEKHRVLIETTATGFVFLDANGRVLDVNDEYLRLAGYDKREQILGRRVTEWTAEYDQARNAAEVKKCIASGSVRGLEINYVHPDKTVVPVEVNASTLGAGDSLKIVALCRDITERKRAETELRRANRAMRMISLCNQEMVRATDEAALLQIICQIIVEHGGYRMAWVGFAEQDEARSVRPVAQAGFEKGYLDTVNITWAEAERGRGPTGTAIRTGQPVLARNIPTNPAFAPWRAAAIQRGYASSIAMPLHGGGRCFGALTIYAMEPDAFDADEVKLMGELAGDLAYGIDVLRQQAERKRAEQALRESEVRYHALFAESVDGILITDIETKAFKYANPAMCRMLGYTEDELRTMGVPDIHPKDALQNIIAEFEALARGEKTSATDIPCLKKDGSVVHADINSTKITIDGRPCNVGFFRDITERKQAAQRVADELNFNQTVLRASPVGIVVFKAAGPCISANEAIGQILGGTREEVLKQNFRQLESWKSSGMLAAAEDALATQTERKLETQMLTTFGKNVWCFCRFAPFHYEGEPHLLLILSDITERKRAEETLREKEHLLSESQRIAHIGSWSWNLTGPIKWIDETYRIYGVSPETFTPTTESLVNLIHPDDRPMMQLWIEACAAGQSPGDLEFRTILPDGSVRLLSGRGKLIYDAENKPAFMIGTVQDITERKRAEDALRESQASLESAQSINRMGSWELDLAAGTGRWSKEMFHLFDRDPALGVPQLTDFLEMVHPEDRTRLLEAHQRVVESGEQCQQEFRTNPARGPICHFATIIQAVKESSGPVRRVAGTVQDITERKQAEERIREQAALLDAANDAIYVRTLDHTVTYWNDGAERLYGRTRAEALGRKIIELGTVDRKAFETAHATLLERGSWSGELKKTSKAGKEFTVFCRWTLLRDEQNRPKEVLAINTDITERKQLEANFLRAQRMEGIGALAGGIAHDLNNILQPILMTAPLLRATTSDPESREMLDTVKNCAQRGADIIKQLLTFARGEPSARVPLPVRHLLNEMSKLIQETFPKNIQLRVNVPKDLWLVLGDATQIHQALMNLCVNARDAMPDGGTLTLTAGNLILDEAFAAMMPSAKPGPHICVSVADTGMGIPPEHLGRIFDPFFTTKEIGKGTGLGLATVLGIARGHGGFVRVNSQAGKGTIFELYLPASSETKAAVSSEHETPPPRAGGELILVVDDEADVRGVIQRTLEKHGYRVLTAAEGTEAMGLFARHRAEIRAVLTDMMMPDMDGPSLVRALRHLDPQLPIVGMTGVGEKADIKGLETLDLLVLLTKPFNSAVLLGVLHQALAAPRKANGKP